MARAKEFDPDMALDRALECFKHHGYSGTSMAALTDAMGIGRASLYATYGDKRRLFEAALETYVEATITFVREHLDTADNPLDGIRDVLGRVAEMAASDTKRRGCLLANSTAELASTDAEIRRFAAASFKRIEDIYYDALETARADGLLPADKNPRALARFLVATMQSLRIIGKASRDRAALDDIVHTALTCLE
ncbi:MAG: TetR/AcrR family transcriptional regulator [Myxococcales bacterium]|nr:MAG: TetR/AcrR family transcriptional regulator [Myxococcales bacterium]